MKTLLSLTVPTYAASDAGSAPATSALAVSARAASLTLALLVASAFAQTDPLPKLEPLPDVPPPQFAIDPALEPVITIRQSGTDKVEEFRAGGKLYMVRITPPGGAPYVLIDNSGSGVLTPAHGQADPRSISVPMWVIKTF